jgi:RNA polymerase primary sigma factor
MSRRDDSIRGATALSHLIASGKAKGFLTYDEVNDGMPESIVSQDEIDAWLSALSREGIEIVEKTPGDEDEDEDATEPEGTSR